jgi:hypothetical protein
VCRADKNLSPQNALGSLASYLPFFLSFLTLSPCTSHFMSQLGKMYLSSWHDFLPSHQILRDCFSLWIASWKFFCPMRNRIRCPFYRLTLCLESYCGSVTAHFITSDYLALSFSCCTVNFKEEILSTLFITVFPGSTIQIVCQFVEWVNRWGDEWMDGWMDERGWVLQRAYIENVKNGGLYPLYKVRMTKAKVKYSLYVKSLELCFEWYK